MDPDFQLIRIWTQEKKFDPDPEQNPDMKHCKIRLKVGFSSS